jgi:hypothetical protein
VDGHYYFKEGSFEMSQYVKNWLEISFRVKQENNFECERCKRSYIENKSLLHTHHLDGDKENNERWNLVCLCADCHSEVQKWVKLKEELLQIKFPFFELCEPAKWLMPHLEGYLKQRRLSLKDE